MFWLFLIGSIGLVLIGVFGLITRSHLIKLLLSLNIIETGINLTMIVLGYQSGGKVPIIYRLLDITKPVNFVDPLPQALVLTSIVIGLGTTALALILIVNYYYKTGKLTLEKRDNEKEEIDE